MHNKDLLLIGITSGIIALWIISRLHKNEVSAANVTTVSKDKFGVSKLYKSVGREWFSNWYSQRSWTSKGFGHEIGSRDPGDSQTFLYCPTDDAGFPNSASTTGNGILTLNGASLRLLVKKPGSYWNNVEVTTYVRDNGKYGTGHSDAVMNISGPSNHDLAYLCNLTGYAYYATVNSGGREEMLKELLHISNPTGGPDGYSLNKFVVPSNEFSAGFPVGQWIGYKLLVQNSNGGKYRRIRYYRDMTNGLNGGDWKLLLDVTDTGNWGVSPDVWKMGEFNDSDCKKSSNKPNNSPTKILNFSANSIQFRVYHHKVDMKKTSVREIPALP